jgi:hypothetical protein
MMVESKDGEDHARMGYEVERPNPSFIRETERRHPPRGMD